MLNVKKIREDFVVLNKPIKGKSLVYFDNACMSLKPKQVVDKINEYYNDYPACGERGKHKLSQKVTEEVWNARKILQKFINAKSEKDIIFTKNTTESLNIVAQSFALNQGDVVLTTDKEHNSNLLPWQKMTKLKGITHEVVLSNSDNTFSLDNFEKKLRENKGKVKLVSMVHTSNMDGTTIPAKEIIKLSHDFGAKVMLDAAQSAPHKELDVRKLDVDFIAFSGHKMLGPTGTGILYGKPELLEKLAPFVVGGGTVKDSTYTTAEWEEVPECFEPGLQDYAGILGFGAAAQYLMKLGLKNVEEQEYLLNKEISERLLQLSQIGLIGPKDPKLRAGIFSFNIKKMDPHTVAVILDQSSNIAVRSGAHCVHSWFNAHNLKGTVRASTYLYNTIEEARFFVEKVKDVMKLSI